MRVIRFQSSDGRVLYGEPHDDGTATRLHGDILTGLERSSDRVHVATLIAPLEPRDIICIGRNYRALADGHAASNGAVADETLEVFLKPSTSLGNPGGHVVLPRFDGAEAQVDCEGELAVVIGRTARNVDESNALDFVFGYTVANDMTARLFQTATGPPLWMRGKGFDGFCPLGPVIVTADELTNAQDLGLRTLVNGVVVRQGRTADMIRPVPQLIAALSRHMTLRAGSVVLTGAPPAPPTRLKAGDVIDVVIDEIGSLRTVMAASSA